MMKKLFTSCILGAAALSVAAESTVTYTYAGDEFGYWGKGKSEIYDVAIRIADPALVGKKITGIRAVLNANEGIEETSLWLSKELTLEKVDGVKVTVPDTYSSAAAVETITMPGTDITAGQLSVTLDTPYELTDEPIYVGYSLTVPKADELTAMQQNPIMLSPCSNENALFVRASKDFLKWVSYNDKLPCAAMIYVTLEGEFPEYSVGIKSLPVVYAKAGEDFTVKASLSNIGASAVSQLAYSYTIAGKAFEKTLDLAAPIEPNFVRTVDVEFPIEAISEIGEYPLDMVITGVNGNANESLLSAASTSVSVLPFVPVHRPMMEEYTGTWCGWCTRGYIALEMLNEEFGDKVVLAAYHNGDPMEVVSSKNYPVSVSGFPSGSINRVGTCDPYYGTGDGSVDFSIRNNIVESMETAAMASIDVVADWANDAKTAISVKAVSTFLSSIENANYKVGYLLLNNGLSGEGSGWNQGNYYSSYAGQYDGTGLEILTTWPSSVEGLTFNDVVVDVTGMMGVNGSVPTKVDFNTPYENEFSFDIANNTVIQDKDKLVVAAFIINPNGTILNANKAVVGGGSAVSAIENGLSEVAIEYYNLNGVRVTNPDNGIFVKVSRLSDGTIRTTKVAK